MLRNADGGGECHIFREMRYKGVMLNIISVTRGWVVRLGGGIIFLTKSV